MEQSQADVRVVAELLHGDAKELRRAVDDHHSGLGAEQAQLQPIDEDPGAARVVDDDVAVGEEVGELLDRRVEVAVPAVLLDVVVRRAERVDLLGGPRLVGDPCPARRPGERARPRRRLDRRRDVAVQLDQRLDVLRSVATPPAVGRHAELVDEALGGDDAGGGPGDAVGRVDQAEVEVVSGRRESCARVSKKPTSTRPP